MNAPQSIAVAVVAQGDRVLIGQRPAGVPLAGYWEFPGGKVHPGESPAEAALRECLEETGIAVELVAQLVAVAHRYDHGDLQLAFFLCRPREPTAEPAAPFRWVAAQTLRQYTFPPANDQVLAELARRFGEGQ